MALVAGLGLMMSGSASAVPWFLATTIGPNAGQWQVGVPIWDGDNDTKFTLVSTTLPDGTPVEFSEDEDQGVEFYNLDIARSIPINGLSIDGPASLVYTMETTDLPFTGVALDFTSYGLNVNSNVTKNVYDITGATLLASLTSTSGRIPPSMYFPLSTPVSAIRVVDTIADGTRIEGLTNEFTTYIIPEIDALAGTGALTLLAGALALAGERRRRSA
jgi:hypothetical protein